MSSNEKSNATIVSQLKERKEKSAKHDKTNKENVLSGLSAHLAVHAERMKLLKRAEEGLEKLSYDHLKGKSPELKKGSENLATTQILEVKQDEEQKLAEKKISKLPVPTARQRRREKQDTGKSRIKIKNYKPGYTWNKGGRVKELRIRCLARKFSQKWKKRTFGRVMPSEARNHYQIHIMKTVFDEWYDMWWHVRKEWRLMVRAECHFRYLAWTKYFEAWKEFIMMRKEDKSKRFIAVKHDTSQTLKKTFIQWRENTAVKKEQHKHRDGATQFYQNNVLKRCWQVWKDKYEIRQDRKNMGVVGLQFWAYRLQLQHWLYWCEAFKKRQTLHNKERLAVRHHKFYTMQRALTAWMDFWTLKRRNKAEKDYAASIYQRSVLVRCMRVWVKQYNTKMMVYNQQAHIQDLADRFTKRQYLQRWLQYVDVQRETQEKEDIADTHYDRKLKVIGVSALKLFVIQRRTKEMQTNMAAEFYVTMLTRRHWNRWMTRCEHNEELAIHSLTVKALSHYKMVICKKLVDAWLDYVEWRKHRQAQYDKADAYYYVRAMPVFLGQIKAHVELQKQKREYTEMAVHFRRENLSARFFYMWYNNFEQSREYRMNVRMAILQHESGIFKRYFCSWRKRHQESIQDHKKQVEAMHYFNTVLCRKHLMAWKLYIDELKISELNDARATKHHYLRQMSSKFRLWKQFMMYKREQRQKKNKADMFYQRLQLRKVMTVLKNNRIQGRKFTDIADTQFAYKCQQVLRSTLQRWRENCEEQKEDKQTEKMAVCHYHRHILNKVTTVWHRYAVIHAYKKSERNQWIENTKRVLNFNKLQRYFTYWRKLRDDSLLNRLKTEQAVQHYNRTVLQNLVVKWKQYVHISIKNKLLYKQCTWFNEIRLKTWSMMVWKEEHIKTQETARKSSLALWHWSLSLQKQMLEAWYNYSQDRKRKKARINNALERRRTRLVRNGVTQWITVADDLSALRAKFAAQQHASKAFNLHQIVQKCALHWRQWAARRKSLHESKAEPYSYFTVQPRVDFIAPQILASQQIKQASYLNAHSLTQPQVTKEVKSGELIPKVSASPVRSKTILPDHLPSKHVEFKLERNIPSRRKPRHPSFLAESLKKAGLFSREEESYEDENQNGTTRHSHTEIPEAIPLELQIQSEISGHSMQSKISDDHDVNLIKNEQSSELARSENCGRGPDPMGNTSTLLVRGFNEKPSTSEQNVSDVENLTQPSEKALSSITSNEKNDKSYIVPKQGYSRFETKLLTPADFLGSKMTSTLTKDAIGELPDVGISPRDRVDGISSINSTLKTKESVDLLSSGNNSAKLKDSYGFIKSADNTTPRSADSLLPINFDSPRSGTALANQVMDIRNRLKDFNEKKKRLRRLQKQYSHLSNWLENEVTKDGEMDTEVIRNEIKEIDEEMRKLNKDIEVEKPMCAKLVSEVQVLVKLLQGSQTS